MSAEWAIIGGLAVSARAAPRFTQDVDFAVSVATDDEAESIIHRLQVRGYAVGMLVEQDEMGRLATVRLIRPVPGSSQIFVDLLFASSGIEDLIVKQADRIEILPGCVAPVASVGHLIALKLLSADESRLQDYADLHALLAVAAPDDLVQARDAVATIVARGFNRGRSLTQDLETLIREQHSKRSQN